MIDVCGESDHTVVGVWVDVLIPLSLIPVTRVAGIFIYRKMAICNEKRKICTI